MGGGVIKCPPHRHVLNRSFDRIYLWGCVEGGHFMTPLPVARIGAMMTKMAVKQRDAAQKVEEAAQEAVSSMPTPGAFTPLGEVRRSD